MKQRLPSAENLKGMFEGPVFKLSADSGLSKEALWNIFTLAYEGSTFEAGFVLARMRWLLSNSKGGINLISEFGEKTPEELANRIMYPKQSVLDFIQKRSSFTRADLEKIYSSVQRGITDDVLDSSMPDFSEERILQEMKWWLVDLDFPAYYFETTPPEEIGNQIRVNRFHEMYGIGSESYANLKISYKSPTGTYIHWVHKSRFLEVENEIERECREKGGLLDVSVYSHADLFLYIASITKVAETSPGGSDFESSKTRAFTKISATEVVKRYKFLWDRVLAGEDIAMECSTKEDTGEHRLMIGFSMPFINHFLSNVSRLMSRAGIKVGRKYCHMFAGKRPIVICSFYSNQPFPEDIVESLVDVSLYPENRIARLVERDLITAREANFINSTVEFVHQFIRFKDANLQLLRERLGETSDLREILRNIQRRTDKDNFPFDAIVATYAERPDIIKALYTCFTAKFAPDCTAGDSDRIESFAKLEALLKSVPAAASEHEMFRWGKIFVDSVLRTNFFLSVKSALAFRLDGDFLGGSDYEAKPYGVFFVKGRDFFGFHVRFKDIARGGIRIVKSSTPDDYRLNADYAFEECYNLANTQNKKNKDIPEGGSKGVIVLGAGKTDRAVESFMRYVDSLLDLLLPGNEKLIKNFSSEILFLGPDEGTGELMDWACERARDRGYEYWKCFTTGKSARLGGVSHIDFGMTTAGIHQYVLGILRKLGIAEGTISKAQTGGPDGDLGGNEILISKDKTIVVVDGGGVVFDPQGLDRRELGRLATQKLDSSNFDESKLGPSGFKVKTSDRDVRIKDGSVIASGLAFRNSFHLDPRMRADLFVPCGGRPKSIHAANWKSLLDADGKPIFKWIVEGANLFITQDARIKLEEKGVLVFKDSSTNKGGVTSSSLEVLAGLALDDKTFSREMVSTGKDPEFRRKYICEILELIRSKADAEFEILWSLHKQTGRTFSELSDDLSEKINEITSAIETSDLFGEKKLRQSVLLSHIPASLVGIAGVDALLARIPLSYQKAIFARALASGFVYKHGIDAGYEAYRRYINECQG
ncbi:MAG: NAD-glutamate dehydrogenase domain-containing protein [Victivallales bacterium]